jgi:hypothetical protein
LATLDSGQAGEPGVKRSCLDLSWLHKSLGTGLDTGAAYVRGMRYGTEMASSGVEGRIAERSTLNMPWGQV